MRKKEIASCIKEKRESLGISVASICRELGIKESEYAFYEAGNRVIPKRHLKNIATFLEIDVSLLERKQTRKRLVVASVKELVTYDSELNPKELPKMAEFFSMIKASLRKNKETKLLSILEAELFHPETLSMVSPRLFARVLLALLFMAGITILADDWILSNFILSLMVPLMLLILLLEFNKARDIKGVHLLLYFFVGGTLSIIVTFFFREIVGYPEVFLLEDLLTAVVEETAKFIVVLCIFKAINIRNVYGAILIGFAVGAGFDAFETSNYGLVALLQEDGTVWDMYGTIVFRSVYALVGIGHHFWTALLAGTFASLQQHEEMDIKVVTKPTFFIVFLITILLHALWNFSGNDGFESLAYVILIASFLIFIRFTKVQYMNDFKEYYLPKESTIELESESLSG